MSEYMFGILRSKPTRARARQMNYEILSRMREGYYLDADMVGGGHAATHLRVYRRAYLIGGCDANLLRHNP